MQAYQERHDGTTTHSDTVTETQRHTDTQTHRHTDTQTHRLTDTQTHRHTDTQTHRHTDTARGLRMLCTAAVGSRKPHPGDEPCVRAGAISGINLWHLEDDKTTFISNKRPPMYDHNHSQPSQHHHPQQDSFV